MSEKITKVENLEEVWVREKLLTPLVDNKPLYISSASKNALEGYIADCDDRKATKKLWEHLLIDAITILKINDSREKVYKDFQANNAYDNFETNFEKIRETNSFGIEELRKYLNDFMEYESILYGTDRHYRDHMNHVFQVWAIGWELLRENTFEMSDRYVISKEHEFHFKIPDSNWYKPHTISQSEIWAMWTIIALCHDLGYPIEKTFKINQKTKDIIKQFGNVQFTELDFSFNILNSFLVEKFLNIISSKAIKQRARIKRYETTIQTKFRDKFSKSLEDHKHGIFSSLLLFKDLTYFLETDYFVKEPLGAEDARQFHIRKEILRSISMHTCPKLYHISLNTLPFLLILCDELQEWSRPNFDNLIHNTLGASIDVSMSAFDIASSIQTIHIKMDYKKKEACDEENIRRRFRNINYLFRGANDDKRRKICFKWEIAFGESLSYIYLFDSASKDSFGQMTVTRIENGDNSDFNIYQPKET